MRCFHENKIEEVRKIVVRQKFVNYHTVLWSLSYLTEKNIRQINYMYLVISLFSFVTFTKFLPKMRKSNFLEFRRCALYTVWKFTNFCLKVIFSKALKNFRENNVLKALYSKNGFRNGPILHVSRKHAQVWPIWSSSGRFGLPKSIETSVIHWTLYKLLMLKVDQLRRLIFQLTYNLLEKIHF